MDGILKWFQTNNGFAGVVVNLILAGITFYYARLTHRLVQEAQKTRLAQIEPHVQIYLEQSKRSPVLINIVVENIGTGPAFEVTFEVEGRLSLQNGKSVSDLGFFKYGLSYLRPGQQIRTFLVSAIDNVDSLNNSAFTIKSNFKDSAKHNHSAMSLVDFRIFEGTAQIHTSEEVIAKSVEKISHTLEQAFISKK